MNETYCFAYLWQPRSIRMYVCMSNGTYLEADEMWTRSNPRIPKRRQFQFFHGSNCAASGNSLRVVMEVNQRVLRKLSFWRIWLVGKVSWLLPLRIFAEHSCRSMNLKYNVPHFSDGPCRRQIQLPDALRSRHLSHIFIKFLGTSSPIFVWIQ